MAGAAKTVFKTLIKVPIYIAVIYLVFNLFSFAISYFRLLGVSYTIQNVVLENNYIPAAELSQINSQLSSMETAILTNIQVVNVGEASTRRQYGETVEVGVQADFIWAVPFLPIKNEAKTGSVIDPSGGSNTLTVYSDATHGTSGGSPIANGVTQTISITYTVPGMAYYPDLDI